MATENLEEKTGGKKKIEGRGRFMKWLRVGAIAAILGFGSGCKAIQKDYQREGLHKGEHITKYVHGETERRNWNYEIYKKNGKIYYRGDVFDGDDRKHYDGVIYPGEVNEELSRKERGKWTAGVAIKLRNGQHYLTWRDGFIGEMPDGSIIEVGSRGTENRGVIPFKILKETYKTIEQEKKEEKEGKKSIWKIMMQNLDH